MAGKLTDLGPVKRTGPVPVPWSGLVDARAGAVVGTRLYVREWEKLYAIDIDPRSPNYLALVHSVRLDWHWLGEDVDDFAYNPADGKLYGISNTGHGHGTLVTIDPVSGKVKKVRVLQQLPGSETYGAVVLDPADGGLWVLNNEHRRASRLYRIQLGSNEVTEVATGPKLVSTDGAGCLRSAPPPVTPPPVSPPPKPPPPPAPPPSTTTTTTPPPPPAVLPVPPPPVVQPPPPPKPRPRTPDAKVAARAEEQKLVRDQRRWTVATAAMIIFGGGAAARVVRSR